MKSNVSILVVEDEPLMRMDIIDELEARGYQVFEAANADEAIVILKKTPSIQILFTDVDMPGSMDGLMLASAVRDRWPPIRIIVTSGHRNVTASDLPEGSRFCGKPYSPDFIAATVMELIS